MVMNFNLITRLQFNYQDLDVPMDVAYAAQNALNPMFWANYNLSVFSQPISQYSMADMINMKAIQNFVEQSNKFGEQLKAQSNLQTANRNITALKQTINSLLNRKNLPADKKQELENIKKELEKLEKKVAQVAERKTHRIDK